VLQARLRAAGAGEQFQLSENVPGKDGACAKNN
jgi:hypothetical protein